MLNVLASVAQWEREATGERTSAAMRHKAAAGEYTGGEVPYGFRIAPDGVALAPDAVESGVRATARDLRAYGLSLRAVARELDRRGWRSRADRVFAPVQIARMLGS